MSTQATQTRNLWNLQGEQSYQDELIVEAPLSLWIQGAPYVVMMRTPGEDLALIYGFLWSSAVIDEANDLLQVQFCSKKPFNRVDVTLESGVMIPSTKRNIFMSSSCGFCSLQEINHLQSQIHKVFPFQSDPKILLNQLKALDEHMKLFKTTGGCHGAMLLDPKGKVMACYEDVGRHNAVDKVLGWALLHVSPLIPRGDHACWGLAGWSLLVSSRAGFEIIHKAASCGISAIVSMGASSTFAHDYATMLGLSLFSFAKEVKAHRHLPLT